MSLLRSVGVGALVAGALLLAGCGPDSGASPSTDTGTSAGSSGDASPASTGDGSSDASTIATSGGTIRGTSDDTTSGDTTGFMGLGGACEGALSDSFVSWQIARDDLGGSYTYSVDDVIVVADPCRGEEYLACDTSTSIVVDGGQVVRRSFSSTPTEGTAPQDCPAAYSEMGAALGTHEDGFPAVVFEDVYAECCDLVQMQGGYHTDYRGDYEPGDVVVTLGDGNLLVSCTAMYCDDCGCTGGPTWSIDAVGGGKKG